MRMAVKTSPTTAPSPFTVARNDERERAAGGFTLSVLAGETAIGRTGFIRWCAGKFSVPSPRRLLDYFGPDATPAAYASVPIAE